MTPAEIYDLVACLGVYEGQLRELPKKKRYTYDEALMLLK